MCCSYLIEHHYSTSLELHKMRNLIYFFLRTATSQYYSLKPSVVLRHLLRMKVYALHYNVCAFKPHRLLLYLVRHLRFINHILVLENSLLVLPRSFVEFHRVNVKLNKELYIILLMDNLLLLNSIVLSIHRVNDAKISIRCLNNLNVWYFRKTYGCPSQTYLCPRNAAVSLDHRLLPLLIHY